MLQQKLGNRADALSLAKTLTRLKPLNMSYKRLLANLYRDTNGTVLAVQLYKELIGMEPDIPQNYLDYSLLFSQVQQYSEARRVLQKGLLRLPNHKTLLDALEKLK